MTERMVTNKNQASPGTSAVKTEQAEVPTSVYDQLLNDPDAYQAYLHTTKGTLSINPDDEDGLSVKKMLDEERVAYLYNPDSCRVRPMFITRERGAIVGRIAIEAHIESLRR